MTFVFCHSILAFYAGLHFGSAKAKAFGSCGSGSITLVLFMHLVNLLCTVHEKNSYRIFAFVGCYF